jgi:two-component system, NarL family, invasion response regulator UvrY
MPTETNSLSKKIRVMLVDDHAVVRVGFRMLLSASADIEVTAEADSGELAYQQYPEIKPDVVIMDLSMPGMGGIETVRRLLARDKGARVLVLSAHEDTAHPKRVLKAGALGYLSKRTAPEELIEAVRANAAGRIYLDAEIARKLATQDLSSASGTVEALSEREFAVFIQLARGQSVNRIAEILKLSPNTVGTHLYNIKQKLGAGNQAELTLIAMRNGLIEA